MSLCMKCREAYWFGGDIKCRLEPFQFRTPEQREIVAWLQHGQPGPCPGFVQHRGNKRNWGLFNGKEKS